MMYDNELNVTLASMCENLLTMAAQPSAAGHARSSNHSQSINYTIIPPSSSAISESNNDHLGGISPHDLSM